MANEYLKKIKCLPENTPSHHRGLECKSRKSRDTGMTGRFGIKVQNEAGKRLTEFFQENVLVITTMTQMTTKVWSLIWSRTSWSVKSNGP